MTNIPPWLEAEEHYKPQKDSQAFLTKSTRAIMSVLSRFKRNNEAARAKESNISLRLFGIFILLILTSVSRNYSFVLFMITAIFVRLALMSGDKIKTWLKTIIPVLLFSLLILLPSIILGSPKTPLTILGKLFVSVSMVLILNLNTSLNEITRALKAFHIPDIIIFTLDIAVKYIFILGEVCAGLLTALKIRSIGKNNDKRSSSAGTLSIVFIKAKEYADFTSKAMECRGFSGKYVVTKEKFKLTKYDLISIIGFLVIAGVFVYLEVII